MFYSSLPFFCFSSFRIRIQDAGPKNELFDSFASSFSVTLLIGLCYALCVLLLSSSSLFRFATARGIGVALLFLCNHELTACIAGLDSWALHLRNADSGKE